MKNEVKDLIQNKNKDKKRNKKIELQKIRFSSKILTFQKSRRRINNIKKIKKLISADKKTDNQDKEILKIINIDKELIVNTVIMNIRKIVKLGVKNIKKVKNSPQKINKDPNPDKEGENKVVKDKWIDKEIEKDNDKEVVNVNVHVRFKNHRQAEIYSFIKVVKDYSVAVNYSNKDSKNLLIKIDNRDLILHKKVLKVILEQLH